MIAWIAANWPSLVAGLAVLALAALCLRNIFPGKGKASCGSCGGNCASCAGCAAARNKKQ